ncbi:hypothetical protein LMH87_004978 [Akanthomyces muscarius]|uniref:Uncharacterized protein n=1 Tax=Akanthomyces muscarius TaxID=2231603 RepID=A0A9W8UNT9_AKAMU|nr:hypothetical protein LMH87_004978 [Akanthomyces muscarius]KAJ4163237.1 hypothetical protein LMH87_004978 [Akanthomyces muscarius]
MAGGTQRQTAAVGNGVLFEVIFKNADPRKQPSHGISLSYGGQVYSCNDAASVRSVHTIHTDDEGDDDPRKSHCQSKAHGRASPKEVSSLSACLKRSPQKSALQPTSLLKPSPKKLKRSQTLSPSHQSRARSILAPFSNLSRKISGRRHSYHESTKTKGDKSQTRQEKTERTEPLLHERPIMQSLPHAFQQAPPQFAYQNSFPMYRYVPVPQPQPMFGAALRAFPVAQGAANTAPQFPPELQHLQGHINHLTTILAANPIDLHAKRELDRLLADRNAFLDSATRRPAPTTTLGHIEASNSKPADLRSIAEKGLTADSVPSNESQKKAAASIASSDERGALNLHICSGCGETRSPSFHRKHPFAKPVHNVCKKCREGRRSSSIMSRYHFCSSCGIVRSKDYHRRRGGETAVSTRSKICRKCHANGDHVYRSTNEACREDEAPTKDRRHKSVDPKPVPCNTPQKGSVRVEPRVRPIHSRRHGGSPDDAETCGYDGVSDLTSATFKTKRTRNERPSVKQEAFTTYQSPEISEDASSNQPASIESISLSTVPEYPIFMEGTATAARSPQISAHGSASEESLHASQQDTTPINPYYQPRNTTGRLSSPFHYEETLYRKSSPASERAPSQDSFRVSDQYSGPCSPEGPHGPRFVDRNQSWPGDLNLPSPGGAFSQFSHTSRKASASEGAPSPITRDYLLPDDFDHSERFTKGAFGKIPSFSSAFRPSSNSPPSCPWASFSGPIPNPSSEPAGSRGAFSNASRESAFGRRYDTSPEPTSPADSPGFPFRFGCQPTSYADRDDERATRGGFASTRGAWNINTAGTSSCAPRHGGNDYVPEPIIEEPSSPLLKSPLTTPLLLEFNLADAMSDSGVELLTDPSSSSASTSSSPSPEDEDLLASRLDSLTVDNH